MTREEKVAALVQKLAALGIDVDPVSYSAGVSDIALDDGLAAVDTIDKNMAARGVASVREVKKIQL